MTLEQVRDRWFLWLLAEELQQLPGGVAVSELYRRRIAGDEPAAAEWKDASYPYSYASTYASACASYAAYAAADASAYDASADAAAAAARAADAADAASACGNNTAAACGNNIWRRMGGKLAELLGEQLPRFSDLHKVISDRVTPHNFAMSAWHCGTSHCRAGHAIDAAGPAGYELEKVFGPELAAATIYLGNTGMLPNFHASDDDALADIRRLASPAQ